VSQRRRQYLCSLPWETQLPTHSTTHPLNLSLSCFNIRQPIHSFTPYFKFPLMHENSHFIYAHALQQLLATILLLLHTAVSTQLVILLSVIGYCCEASRRKLLSNLSDVHKVTCSSASLDAMTVHSFPKPNIRTIIINFLIMYALHSLVT
jgi:hypothetical protein